MEWIEVTGRTVEEAKEAVNWAYFPPLGKRSLGGGAAFVRRQGT